MSSTYHLLLMATFCLSCPLWHLKVQVRNAAQWTTWTRCATVTIGASPKPQISKMILDYSSGGLLVHVISNFLTTIMIICIAIGASKTTLNVLVQIISHLLWVMFPLLDPLLSVMYVDSDLCALFCIILE